MTPTGDRAYRGRLAAASRPPAAGSPSTRCGWSPTSGGSSRSRCRRCGSPAAVRAQAVAARTYAAYERAHPRSSAFDVYDTTACQVYGGVGAEHPASDAAIRATRRTMLEADGAPAFTQFSSSNGGWSVGGLGVLPAGAGRTRTTSWSGNPVHDWSVTVPRPAFERAGPSLGNLRRIAVVRRDGNGDWGGRVTSLRLVGSRNTRHRLRRHDALGPRPALDVGDLPASADRRGWRTDRVISCATTAAHRV